MLIGVKIHRSHPPAANPFAVYGFPFVNGTAIAVVPLRRSRIPVKTVIGDSAIPINEVTLVIVMVVIIAGKDIEEMLVTVPNDFVPLIPFGMWNVELNLQFDIAVRRKISVEFMEADVIDRRIAGGLNARR